MVSYKAIVDGISNVAVDVIDNLPLWFDSY